ncbi:MAG: cytochrome c biogenesis protein CcdA [Arachnia sp.]
MGVGFAGAFLGGLAALLSPCAAMLLPSFFAYAFGSSRTRLLGRTGLFYLGLLITLVPLGLAAGSLGALLATHRSELSLVGGVLLIVLGLLQVFGISFNIPGFRSGGGTGPFAVIALGAVYGLAGACTGPLLGAVLTMAAVGGSPLYGALLLAMFGAGMVVPLIVLAWVWDSTSLAEKLRPRPLTIGPVTTSVWGLVSGVLFVVLGVLFLATDATSALGGIFDARQQLRLETALGSFADAIPDIAALLVVAAVVGLIVWQARKPRTEVSSPTKDDSEAR